MPIFRTRWALAGPLALLLALTAAPAVLAQDPDEFDRIAAETAELRELPIEQEIVEAFLTRDELEQRLLNDLATDYPAAEVAADERALKALGLIEEDVDLSGLVLDLYTEQVAGFYDPETDEMYVIGEDDDLDALEEFTYAHEVIHALQDQAFDLVALQTPLEDGTDDDRSYALSALIEGDATVGSLEYVINNPILAGRIALAGTIDTPVFDGAPPILTTTLIFPYLAGQNFVSAVRGSGGWEAVDAVYADPPTSTEQILHPEKYTDERDDPTEVTLPDLAAALGNGWTKAEENNFGEFQTLLLLAQLDPGDGLDASGGFDLPESATEAAAGWDGDRYSVWANGDDDVVLWRTVWDSEADATEFAQALQASEGERLDSGFEGESPDDVALVTESDAARIVTDGTEVVYVLAPTLELVDAAIGALASS